jgi:hypothetical protein
LFFSFHSATLCICSSGLFHLEYASLILLTKIKRKRVREKLRNKSVLRVLAGDKLNMVEEEERRTCL